jgi:L-alanine-DL-glutamate epimerase-like enolase superfamily enzyme
VVDIVRSDVSWKHGVTAVMKTAHLAESFGMNCEVHTAIYHPLEVVNLQCCCAMRNCEFFELLYPLEYMNFGMLTPLDIDAEGFAHPPQAPGAGFDPDWDLIDNATLEVF